MNLIRNIHFQFVDKVNREIVLILIKKIVLNQRLASYVLEQQPTPQYSCKHTFFVQFISSPTHNRGIKMDKTYSVLDIRMHVEYNPFTINKSTTLFFSPCKNNLNKKDLNRSLGIGSFVDFQPQYIIIILCFLYHIKCVSFQM